MQEYGVCTKYYSGNLKALQNEVCKGMPVIVMIRVRTDKNWLHYVPVIVFGQLLISGGAIAISYKFKWDCYEYEMLNIPLKIIGILSVIFGLYLNYSAKHISNLFENVSENRLIQDGIYGYVRNPVYSAAFFVSIGTVSMTNRLILLVAVGIICWSYMTLLLVVTEEKWLRDLYGKQYEDYCNRVNRCIPWFRNKVL